MSNSPKRQGESPGAEQRDIGGQTYGPDVVDHSRLPDLAPERRRKVITMGTDVAALDKQLKVARSRDFEFHCDEPEWLGGEDQHPQPLIYLTAAVGF
jgi:hypothetical protein